MDSAIQAGVNIFNVVFLAGGIALFFLSIVVLLKLNKALNIWLRKNKD